AEVDAERELTEKGRSQCEQFGKAWASTLHGVTNVLASPVRRTAHTAALVAEPLGLGVTPVEGLYFVQPWRTAEMKAADADVGYAPVGEYISRHPGVYDKAAEMMATAVAERSGRLVPGDLLIVGHAGYLSFLALEVVEALAPASGSSERDEWLQAARKVVLDANVGEVCGFEIGAPGRGARYLPNPESTDFAAASSNDAFIINLKVAS
ncbi:unnamed protein product, partial [Polarella glacialis]